jgi:hypothetical protein
MFGSFELPTPDPHRCDGIAATITPWVPGSTSSKRYGHVISTSSGSKRYSIGFWQ